MTAQAIGYRRPTSSQTSFPINTYDALYELTTVTQGPNTTESYSFDAVGNRLSSLNVPSYTYNSSNELTAQTGVTYAYDNNGNLISKTGGTTYSWDFENRLTRVILPGNSQINFKYDPMGRRIQKSSSAGTVNYIYDQTNVLEEVDTAGTLVTRYTQNLGIDERLVTLKSGTASYYEADALGSVTTLSNSSGALAKTYSYDSFGRLLSSSGTIANPYGFSGRKLDSETGLMYYRARYYDPVVGRFIAEDPIGFKGGFNFYEYTGNNVTNAIDPMGLEWWYSQATGQVSHFDPETGFTFVATGYAGHMHGLNNPSLQGTLNIGPIPVGNYTIAPQRDNVTTNRTILPASMRLIPDPKNWMFGRAGFLIHGGDMEKRTSSNGCIILPLEIRNLIGNSNDKILIVY